MRTLLFDLGWQSSIKDWGGNQASRAHLRIEGLWQRLDGEGTWTFAARSTVDAELLIDDEIEIAVQVIGKVRGRVKLSLNVAQDITLAAARKVVSTWLDGKKIVKEIVEPNKLVNFVAK